MVAKILLDNGEQYTSPIYAVIGQGFETKVIVLNQDKTNLIEISMFKTQNSIERYVFVFDNNTDGWKSVKINNIEVRGYDWLINNYKNLELNKDLLQYALEIFQSVVENNQEQWTYVKNDQDIENLMEVSYGFMMATFKKFNIIEGKVIGTIRK